MVWRRVVVSGTVKWVFGVAFTEWVTTQTCIVFLHKFNWQYFETLANITKTPHPQPPKETSQLYIHLIYTLSDFNEGNRQQTKHLTAQLKLNSQLMLPFISTSPSSVAIGHNNPVPSGLSLLLLPLPLPLSYVWPKNWWYNQRPTQPKKKHSTRINILGSFFLVAAEEQENKR